MLDNNRTYIDRDVGAPKRDFVLSWLDYWADTYGQHMPHKTLTVIYAANKGVSLFSVSQRVTKAPLNFWCLFALSAPFTTKSCMKVVIFEKT